MSLKVFETLSTQQAFPIEPSTLLGGNNTVILADPRKGKSYTAAKVCEQLSDLGLPFVIIDPEGEYYSLREKYGVFVAGFERTENCDVAVGVEHAELMANQFLNSRVPLILDLSSPDAEEEDTHLFLEGFMKRLITQAGAGEKVPCLIVIDEADEYIPERGHKGRGPDYAQFGKLVKKGGKRGIGTIIISHRPAWVAKDLLAKCQNWILMHQTYKDDLQRIEDLTRIPMSTLLRLKERKEGEALLYGAISQDQIVWAKCLSRETTHIGTTPTIKPKFVQRPELEGLLKGFRVEIERLTRRREAERTEIARLTGELQQRDADLKKKDEEIRLLKTARVAAGMVTRDRPPEPRSPFESPAEFEDYQSLKNRVAELEEELKDWQQKERQKVPSFWIDDFGSVYSQFPWLTRLIDLNRIKAIIVKHLWDKPGSTLENITLSYGWTAETIRSHLNDLIKRGVVRRSDNRPYRYFLREA